MNIFTVSFFGHRQIEDAVSIEEKLEALVISLLRDKPYVEFLVGRNGAFDILAASVIRRCKRKIRSDNSALIWVLPYATAELLEHEKDYLSYYDEIEICEEAAAGYAKSAFQRRNRAMVDRSDLVVFCVQRKTGGAWQTMRYTINKEVHCVNLCSGQN